jgi:hypothetical protein
MEEQNENCYDQLQNQFTATDYIIFAVHMTAGTKK